MISVFTPTYNRAYILPILYESLKWQTCHDFEWIIVDDGSTDNTEEIVCSWQKEKKDFPIVYRKQQNGGKHTTINHGVSLARGEWLFIVDSADLEVKNFEGYTYVAKQRAKAYSGLEKLRYLCAYIKLSKRKGLNCKETAQEIDVSLAIIWCLTIVVILKEKVRR